MAHIKKLGVLLILLLIVSGCEREGKNIPTSPPTANYYLQTGWTAYEKGDYEAALDAFIASKARDAINEDAYNGLGWTYAKLQNYDLSISNFLLLLSLTDSDAMKASIYAGLAMTYSARQMVTTDAAERQTLGMNAIDYAQKIIDLDPNFKFEHDTHIDVNSLHAVIAQCHFNMEDFLSALKEVENYLDTGFRQSLLDNNIIKKRQDTLSPVILPATAFSGNATLTVTFERITDVDTLTINAEIVDVFSIKNVTTNKVYDIVSFDQGGNDITFSGNPLPKEEDMYGVDYSNADDYGLFLKELINTIKQYQ